jgi:hypothetical protein
MPTNPPLPDPQSSDDGEFAKRDYHAPELQELGTVTEITASGPPADAPYDSGTGYVS